MRVIGGEFRSRVLKSIPGDKVRPTPDRLRESLFSVLQTRIRGAIFADLYAGTGAVGIEAISRGASRAILVEHHRSAIAVIRHNIEQLKIADRVQVREGRAASLIPQLEADIFFLDPPYHLEQEYEQTMGLLGEHKSSLVIVQHPIKLTLNQQYGAISLKRLLKQGDNALSFYERAPSLTDSPD